MWMVTEDGFDQEIEGEEEEEEADQHEDHDHNKVKDYSSLCRFCGKVLGDNKVGKKDKSLPSALSKLYGVDVHSEPDYFPQYVHRSCFQSLERSHKKVRQNSPANIIPITQMFSESGQRCSGCSKFDTGHNLSTCPEVSERSKTRKRKKLMELVKRDQGNVRSKSWYEFTEKFCKDNGEDIEDLLSFNLRRVMLQRGKKAKADTLEKLLTDKLLTDKQTSLDPLSPRTTWSRQVCSQRSVNQYKDDWKFGKQKKRQVLASPDKVEIEKFRITQKNVSFKLTSGEGEVFEYTAPTVPPKPFHQLGWKELSFKDKRACWKTHRQDMKEYKKLLRPDHINPPSDLPECVQPSFIAVGNPYPNILAFSLYDIREDIFEKLLNILALI